MTTLFETITNLEDKERTQFMTGLSEEELATFETQLKNHNYLAQPSLWVEEVLGSRLWSKQKEIINSFSKGKKRTAVRSCHGAGKSHVAARTALGFLQMHENSIVVTTAPTFRQVKRILWKEIRSAFANSKNALRGTPLITELNINEEWFAFGFSTKDPDAFQGLHAEYILVIFDEASGIEADIWTSAEGVLSNEHAYLLTIGNPTDPASLFAYEFKDADITKISISAFETPNFTEFGITPDDIANDTWKEKITRPLPYPALVSPSWVAKRFRKWRPDSPLYQARVLGQFPDQGTDTLIPLAWIERAINLQEGEYRISSTCIFGNDVAYKGQDDNVIIKLSGDTLRTVDVWSGQDTQGSAGRVIYNYNKHTPERINVDAIGYGAGVADALIDKKFPAQRIFVNERSSDQELYMNQRAEFYWLLRERFQANEIKLFADDEELQAQLSSLKYKINTKGQIQIESKDDMRSRLGRSPDYADGAMLCMAEEQMSFLVPSGAFDLGTTTSKWRI